MTILDEKSGRFVLFTMIFMQPYEAHEALPGDGNQWTYGFTAISPGPTDSIGSQAMIVSY